MGFCQASLMELSNPGSGGTLTRFRGRQLFRRAYKRIRRLMTHILVSVIAAPETQWRMHRSSKLAMTRKTMARAAVGRRTRVAKCMLWVPNQDRGTGSPAALGTTRHPPA